MSAEPSNSKRKRSPLLDSDRHSHPEWEEVEESLGDQEEAFRRGMQHLTEGRYRRAVDLLRRAALEGHRRSRIIVSALAAGGVGTLPDADASLRWLQAPEGEKDPEHLYHLAKRYQTGEGVEQNYAEAADLLYEAAQQGYAPAQNNLGAMYANGCGVERDIVGAVRWFRNAASQGNAMAQNNLGAMYADGRGVEKDEREAVRWFRKAADQECASAQLNLGLMYLNGRGVEPDAEASIQWVRKAASLGLEKAQAHLWKLNGSFSRDH